MVSTTSLHAIRLFYAAYFAAMGIILPYFPVFLADMGLEVAMIGVMTGLLAVAKVVAPPWVGQVADRKTARQARLFIVSAALLAAVFAYAMKVVIGLDVGLWWLAVMVLAFGVLWASILPLTDSLSIAVSEATLADYGRLRVWGSIGFVLASMTGGMWLLGDAIRYFPECLMVLLLLTAMAAYGFPEYAVSADVDDGNLTFNRALFLLFGVSFIMQMSHGAYYGFYSLYLVELGYSGWQIGAFWVLGVMAEIVLMWGWSKPLQRAAPSLVLSVCLLLAAVRWLGIGLTGDWWWLLVLQLLHAASFAAFHLSAVAWVKRFAPNHRHAAAQGWYSATGFGLGSTVGIMGCGVIAEAYGFSTIFFICALVALMGSVVAWRLPKSI